MGKWFRGTGARLFLGALSLALVGTLVTLVLGGSSFAAWTGRVTRPLEAMLTGLEGEVTDLYDRAFAYQRLQAEYEALQAQVDQLKAQARTGEILTSENQRLRSLLSLGERRQDWTLEAAMVLSASWDSWSVWVKLDKGQADGLEAGDCVVDAAGALVGRVTETGEDWSYARLVTDPALTLSVRLPRTGERGVCGGNLSLLPQGKMTLENLPLDCSLLPGDELVTLATRGTYPSGILVGTVESLREDPSGLWKTATVVPAADLSHLTQVFCVTDFTQED